MIIPTTRLKAEPMIRYSQQAVNKKSTMSY